MTNTKLCSMCKTEKSKDDFYGNIKRCDGLQTRCKECSRKHSRDRYSKEKAKLGPQIRKANKERIKRNIQFVWQYAQAHGCIDCGNKNPVVLEFDHVRGKKCGAISQLIYNVSLGTLKEEIEKCEVRCANCHRIKTSIQLNWYATFKNDT